MAEKDEKQKRKKPGRPLLRDQLSLTPEMEEFANHLRAGFTPEEASERMDMPLDKALQLAQNQMVQNRVKVMLGDKMHEWAMMRDQLYETCLKTADRLIREGKVPWKFLFDMIDRMEESFGIFKKTVKEEKTKSTSTKELAGDEGLLLGDGSIFRAKQVESYEHETREE